MMTSHLEESLERDIERIRGEIRDMSAIAERSLRDCARAFVEDDRQLAYAVILRDQYIDEKEKAIDQLCLEFLVRQQPVGTHLRFAYSAIKINLELERVGDYAESVARQVVKLDKFDPAPDVLKQWITEMAERSIPMLHEAIEAFVTQDAERAEKAMEAEPAVDALKRKFNAEVINLVREQKIPPEAIAHLMTIGRRFERVAELEGPRLVRARRRDASALRLVAAGTALAQRAVHRGQRLGPDAPDRARRELEPVAARAQVAGVPQVLFHVP